MSLTITIPGAVNVTTGSMAPAVLTIGVGVPGAQGPAGPAGQGVPAGGSAGQFLQKIDGVSYNTDWVTLNLGAYAPLASPAFTGNPTAPTPALGDNDTSIATTAFVQSALLGGTAIARNLEVEVRNQSGSTIPAGSIVYISGATGNKPLITLAQANNDTNSAQTIGFVKTAIANNGTGYVIVRGELENINTSALAEGVQLYLSPTTAGTWTTTKPSAPQHLVYVGIVIRSHPTLGVILVAVQNGYELDELHDVSISSKANNDLLAYESSSDLWKNKSFGSLGLATQSWVTSQGYLSDAPSDGNQYLRQNGAWTTVNFPPDFVTSVSSPLSVASGDLSIDLSPYETVSSAAATYQTISGMSSYLTTAAASANYQTISGMNAYATLASPALTGNVTITSNSTSAALFIEQAGTGNILTLHDQASDTSFVAIDANGKVNTIPSTTAGAGFNIPHATAAPSAPVNGDIWTTTTALQVRINGSTQNIPSTGGSNTYSGNNIFSGQNLTFGSFAGASTINIATGVTPSGSTKTLTIAAGGLAGSTTNILIGSNVSTSTTTLQGTTNGVTAAADTNSVALATTAFVVGQAGSATPLVNGTAAVGTSLRYARQDHVHGTDTTRAPLASPTFTGTPLSTTAAVDTNTTQIATTAFVVAQAASATPLVNGTAAVGTSLRYARADHVHPTDTSRAPLASPAFTGTPSLPTGTTAVTQTAGTNNTTLATTAFVQQEVPAASTTAAGKVELATLDEAILGASTTLVPSAFSAKAAIMSADWMPVPRIGFTATTSGTGAACTLGSTNTFYQLPTSGSTGHSYARTYGVSQVDQLTNLWGDDSNVQVNFAKRIWISGRSLMVFPAITNMIARVTLGKAEASGVGDLAARGIGWKYTTGTSQFVQLMVHDGTTLTTVNSSFTPSNVAFDWDVVSEGNGNVTLYINGSSVATTSAGPSTRATSNQCLYQEEAVVNGTIPNAFCRFYCARGAIYVQR